MSILDIGPVIFGDIDIYSDQLAPREEFVVI